MPTFYTLEKIEKQLIDIRSARIRAAQPIPAFKFQPADVPGAQQPGFDDSAWPELKVGDSWGGYDVTAWFRARVPVPADWQEHQLALHILIGPPDGGDGAAEGMLYLDGVPVQALDTWHHELWLHPDELQAGALNVAIRAW